MRPHGTQRHDEPLRAAWRRAPGLAIVATKMTTLGRMTAACCLIVLPVLAFAQVVATRRVFGRYQLTDTERRIVKLVAQGRTSREIGDQLNIGVRSVAHHRASIATKFGLQGSHSLVKFAVKHEPEIEYVLAS